jgi:hypothetical protein
MAKQYLRGTIKHMTFNHGVEGSSPSALTMLISVQPGHTGNRSYLRHG